MPTSRGLSSAFAADLAGYVDCKRAVLGYKATMEEGVHCPCFDRFCRDEFPGKAVLDMELALAWVGGATGAVAAANRASFLRGFAKYVILMGGEACVLPGKAAPVRRPKAARRVFSRAELASFFGAADSLAANPLAGHRHLIAPVIFRLLYCTGLRPYEARTLPTDRFDLDGGVIHVVDSKGKDRDVPVRDDVAEMCSDYSGGIESLLPGRAAFFPNRDGSGRWSWHSMYSAFRLCLERAGIDELDGPRLVPYSFRHTFATDCIRRWKEQGADVEGNLSALQVYMGHELAEQTLYYVHLVRGGPGDPAPYGSWEPVNRMREEGLDG